MKCIWTGFELDSMFWRICEYLSSLFPHNAVIALAMSFESAPSFISDLRSWPCSENKHVYMLPLAEILALVHDSQNGFEIDSINPI